MNSRGDLLIPVLLLAVGILVGIILISAVVEPTTGCPIGQTCRSPCPGPVEICGDGICSINEDDYSCPGDCIGGGYGY